MEMEKLADNISADPSFLRIFVLLRKLSDSIIASINERYEKEAGVRINWEAELRRWKSAIKDLRVLQARLVKAGKTAVMPSIPDSVGLALEMPNEKAVEFIKSAQTSLTELKSRYPKISDLQKDELYNLFFLSLTKFGLSKKQEVGKSDTYTIWDCLRDAYEELQRNEEALKECEERCEAIWAAESASIYATWLSSSLACLALSFPPAQVICGLAALAIEGYWLLRSAKDAENCAQDCEALYA